MNTPDFKKEEWVEPTTEPLSSERANLLFDMAANDGTVCPDPVPENVYPTSIPEVPHGAGQLWRHKEYKGLFILAQVAPACFAFISLEGNRFREPAPWEKLPLELFERVTSKHVVKFIPRNS